MKNKMLVLMLMFSISSAFAKVYYVSPKGKDSNNGSINKPFATIQQAQKAVEAGDTVYLRGGVYKMTESQIALKEGTWAYVTYLDKSGTEGKRINYWAYPNEQAIFDLSEVKPANCRVHAFQVMGSWIHLKGLEVIGVQVTILTHTQSECFENQGDNNIYEQLKMHDTQAIGFYLKRGSNNLILNCDAYRNFDYTSEKKTGGNADGFGFHPQKACVNNVIRGCRAWFNSDDGYDCINAHESITFENCWAFYNGFSSEFKSLADGNGFKIGGFGQIPKMNKVPNPIPSHTVRFCMAYRNKANGFYSNHHLTAGSFFYNNTAYKNAINFNMLSQKLNPDGETTQDVAGFSHTLHNNISIKSEFRDTLNLGTCTFDSNAFGVDVSNFISVDESFLTAPRQANGDLPDNPFLHLKPSSDLIDKGKNLGLPYQGAAPDMGAFESKK